MRRQLTPSVRQEDMMNIKASLLNRITWMASILAIPFVLFLMFRPDWGTISSVLVVVSYSYLGFIGGSGFLMAFLIRFGVVVFVFSPRDKQSMFYRMNRDCAALDKKIWGNIFSKKYYDTFLEEEENHDRRTTESNTTSD